MTFVSISFDINCDIQPDKFWRIVTPKNFFTNEKIFLVYYKFCCWLNVAIFDYFRNP
eukprot:TRINITY_DN12456_c0_g1_i1.p1 TRINITY_DN12456_c0_g1~~TRINITY_DN12456_c0_g1_i1.p1  ORF type:complete len:57 (-),score=8.36 TRINITY_DN12456_c0_g1_i1:271-441(-)